jgi:hypothetical protein
VVAASARAGTGINEFCYELLTAAAGPACVAAESGFFRDWVERRFGQTGPNSLDFRPDFEDTAGGYDGEKRIFSAGLLPQLDG